MSRGDTPSGKDEIVLTGDRWLPIDDRSMAEAFIVSHAEGGRIYGQYVYCDRNPRRGSLRRDVFFREYRLGRQT